MPVSDLAAAQLMLARVSSLVESSITNTTAIAMSATAPYNATWSNVAAGSYSLTNRKSGKTLIPH